MENEKLRVEYLTESVLDDDISQINDLKEFLLKSGLCEKDAVDMTYVILGKN